MPGSAFIFLSWLTFSWIPNGGVYEYPQSNIYLLTSTAGHFVVDMDMRIENKWIFARGDIKIPMTFVGANGFYPFQLQSTVEAGLTFDWLTIGYRHNCSHPIIPYIGLMQWFGDVIQPGFDSWYDEIYVRIGNGR